jgi:hypothetical protein
LSLEADLVVRPIFSQQRRSIELPSRLAYFDFQVLLLIPKGIYWGVHCALMLNTDSLSLKPQAFGHCGTGISFE